MLGETQLEVLREAGVEWRQASATEGYYRGRRDVAIYMAARAGAPHEQIAELAGLTEGEVAQVVTTLEEALHG